LPVEANPYCNTGGFFVNRVPDRILNPELMDLGRLGPKGEVSRHIDFADF